MIRVWADSEPAGVLDRLAARGSTFAYDPRAKVGRAVSMTMPVRVQSWDSKFGLLPIFEMNLPEGALREKLSRRFAKATGSFDDIDLLSIVGRTQIGRVRYSALDGDISETVPFQSIDEVLRARRDGDLFAYLLEKFAEHSGLSGVQPKVMIRGSEKISDPKVRRSPSIQSATHIVKFWDENEYPELAANEYFCLQAAKRLGLDVPDFQLTHDGGALVIERFDLVAGRYLGFEDFCVLNGLGTRDKYRGGYETRVFKRMKEFAGISPQTSSTMESLLLLFLLNCAIRNGDAHLKNFGMVYADVAQTARIAPAYDLISTWAYIPDDPMALTLEGSTKWPDRAGLIRLARTRCDLGLKRVEELIEMTADAMATVAPEVRHYFASNVSETGTRMLAAWESGIKDSLGLVKGLVQSSQPRERQANRIPDSDARLLEYLRQNKGRITGTQRIIAEAVGMPPSTLNASVARLVSRNLIARGRRSIALVDREV